MAIVANIRFLVIIISAYSVFFSGMGILRGDPVSPQVTMLAYTALCLILYHLEVAISQIALTRFLVPLLPFALLLAVSPLGLIGRRTFKVRLNK